MRTIWTIIKPISHGVRLPKKVNFDFNLSLFFSYLWNINNIGQQSSQLWNNTIRKGPPTIRIIIRILETGKIGTPRNRLTTQSGTYIYIKEKLAFGGILGILDIILCQRDCASESLDKIVAGFQASGNSPDREAKAG